MLLNVALLFTVTETREENLLFKLPEVWIIYPLSVLLI